MLWSCQNYIFFLLLTNSQYKPFEGANKENSSNKGKLLVCCSLPIVGVTILNKNLIVFSRFISIFTNTQSPKFGVILANTWGHFITGEIIGFIEDNLLSKMFDIILFLIYPSYWEVSHKSANFHILRSRNMTTHSSPYSLAGINCQTRDIFTKNVKCKVQTSSFNPGTFCITVWDG